MAACVTVCGSVISRVHFCKDMHIFYCPLFSKCLLPFCDVSAGFNVMDMDGEKKLNDSNLIIKYSSCSNFNLGMPSKIMPVIGGYSKHSLVDRLSPIVSLGNYNETPILRKGWGGRVVAYQ